jgi:Na+/melibiose symporter-like transporter
VGIYALLAIVFFFVTFFTTKERVQPPRNQKADIRQDFADLRKNGPWLAMFGMVLFVFITLALRGGSFYYYFTYFVDSAALSDFVKGAGLIPSPEELARGGVGLSILDLFGLVLVPGVDASKVGFSLFNMTGSIISILGILAAKPLAVRFGKKAVFVIGLSGATLIQFLFVFLSPEDIGTMFLLNVLSSASYGPTIPLLWAMMGDVADYSEWKTHRRSTGFVFAGLVFALKAGLGFGGAIAGWLLSAYGYTPETARSPEVLAGLRLMASIYSGIPFGLGVLCMLFYPINKEMALEISRDLDRRRTGPVGAVD